MADFYELLGVSRSASADEIKKAYRKRARELHPDANPGDARAAEEFKEVARAYQVLSDPEQRRRYDQFGEAGVGGAAGGPSAEDLFGGGLGDIFDAFFGGGAGGNPFGGGGARQRGPSGPPRGQDLEVVADIPFETAVFGGQVSVSLKLPQKCDVCEGSGAGEGTKPVTCSDCNGSGQVQRVRQSLLARAILVPYGVGYHLAHHVDSGVPFRNLPALTRILEEDGYITPDLEWPSYPALWRALVKENQVSTPAAA